MGQPIDIGMPESIDVGQQYTLRVTALNPTNGNLVAGVIVNKVVLTVQQIEGTADELQTGQWFLVPGPNA